MLIDCHVHIGEDKKYGFVLKPEDFVKKMSRNFVDYAIIFPCPWPENSSYIDENDYVIKMSLENEKLIPVLFVNPFSKENVDSAKAHLENGRGKGIKLHPLAGEYKPKDILKTDILKIGFNIWH